MFQETYLISLLARLAAHLDSLAGPGSSVPEAARAPLERALRIGLAPGGPALPALAAALADAQRILGTAGGEIPDLVGGLVRTVARMERKRGTEPPGSLRARSRAVG